MFRLVSPALLTTDVFGILLPEDSNPVRRLHPLRILIHSSISGLLSNVVLDYGVSLFPSAKWVLLCHATSVVLGLGLVTARSERTPTASRPGQIQVATLGAFVFRPFVRSDLFYSAEACTTRRYASRAPPPDVLTPSRLEISRNSRVTRSTRCGAMS
ncbi:hypothetical protein C8F01DRAFT_641359 [Mycena amicta]|nr:hypothetical protein C8F01DRAFT_641359 [Mycena amicta]